SPRQKSFSATGHGSVTVTSTMPGAYGTTTVASRSFPRFSAMVMCKTSFSLATAKAMTTGARVILSTLTRSSLILIGGELQLSGGDLQNASQPWNSPGKVGSQKTCD